MESRTGSSAPSPQETSSHPEPSPIPDTRHRMHVLEAGVWYGLLLSIILYLALTLKTVFSGDPDVPWAVLIATLVLCALAWYGLRKADGRSRALTVVVVLTPLAAGAYVARSWWRIAHELGASSPVLVSLTLALTLIGCLAALTALPARAPAPPALPSTLRGRVFSGVVAVVVLGLAGTAYASPTLALRPSSTTVSAVAPPPLPHDLGTTTAWQRTLEGPVLVLSTSAGPVAVDEHGAQGLDPRTGQTTWSYHQIAPVVRISNDPVKSGEAHAALSPDGTRLALLYRLTVTDPHFQVVVLDTSTGEVVLDRTAQGDEETENYLRMVQLTDHVLLFGPEVISLEDGTVLGASPGEFQVLLPRTGGHSTLVLDVSPHPYDCSDKQTQTGAVYCEPANTGPEFADLTVAPDTDPSATSTVPLVALTPGFQVVITDGWAAQSTDSELGSIDEAGRIPATRPLQAVNLDALSGAGPQSSPVELGELSWPTVPASRRYLNLARTTNEDIKETQPLVPVAKVFDPGSSQVLDPAQAPADAQASSATLSLSHPATDTGNSDPSQLTVTIILPTGQSHDVTIADLPPMGLAASVYHTSYWPTRLVTAPGVTTLAVPLSQGSDVKATVIVGLM